MNKLTEHKDFREILQQYKGILFKISRAYCPRQEDREDLIQEMMIQIWQALPRYNNQYQMSTFIYRIGLNTAISYHRKTVVARNRNTELTDNNLSQTYADDTEKEVLLNKLEQFISELKDLDKALILLYLDEKSHSEISDILGLSLSNVGTKIARIKGLLKKRFQEQNNN